MYITMCIYIYIYKHALMFISKYMCICVYIYTYYIYNCLIIRIVTFEPYSYIYI